MTVTLSPKQNAAIEAAITAVENGKDFSVSGLAGTGKTVVLCHLTRLLRERGYNPQVCAPTGKAAFNVTKKFPELMARTLHSALSQNVHDKLQDFYDKLDELTKKRDDWSAWNTSENKAELPEPVFTDEEAVALVELPKVIRKLRENIDTRLEFTAKNVNTITFNVLIFDEASMIGEKIYEDLIASIPVPKIYFGDHGQLPPVKDQPAIDLRNADAVLDEVHRQKEGSGILKLAYAVNRGEYLKAADYDDCSDVTFVGSSDVSAVLPYADTHQIVCWKNVDRHSLNMLIREKRLGIKMGMKTEDWVPRPGEELICDQNTKAWFNGDPLAVVEKPEGEAETKQPLNPYMRDIWMKRVGDDDTTIKKVRINIANLMPKDIDLGTTHEREDAERWGLNTIWSYAITCHKAQGSEYPHVVVFNPSTIANERSRWLYTAVTRASKSLVLISSDYRIAQPRTGPTLQQRLANRRKSA